MAPWPLVREQFYGCVALGKVSSASVIEALAVGVNVIYNALDAGFPNPRRTLSDLTNESPDPLNPRTGRKKSMMAVMRQT
ncbi:unnamed protein product [Angiostrongylus costaricensis]|uniref:DHO_dh domain-containing protein n=1 Tax=Angiostrongylus costaricensis TaxID=334426 RepID=A0A0R3PIA4_ANGCS|nr:unnamed protein product [Angiostrongylus costaricensis]